MNTTATLSGNARAHVVCGGLHIINEINMLLKRRQNITCEPFAGKVRRCFRNNIAYCVAVTNGLFCIVVGFKLLRWQDVIRFIDLSFHREKIFRSQTGELRVIHPSQNV